MEPTMKKTTAILTALALCVSLISAASAKTPSVKTTKPKPKTTKQIGKDATNKAKQTQQATSSPNLAALNNNLDGVCHRKRSGSTERNYKAMCMGTRTGHISKHVNCNGSRDSSRDGMYKTQYCTLEGVPQPNRFEINHGPSSDGFARASEAADLACGCGPHVSRAECSGGVCSSRY